MRKVIFMAASVVYGDYCHREKGIDIRVALKGDRLDINASGPDAWVGVGVPKSADYDEMARGNFVLGSGNELYEYKLEMDYNWKPNVELKSVVEGTGEVNAVNGRTNISFTRMLSGPGLNTIDPSKPFNLLFASGNVKEGETGYAALEYHIANRGHARVNFQKDNCGSIGGKRGKKGKGGLLAALRNKTDDDDDDSSEKGKLGESVRRDASSCAAILCAANTRCVNGKCVPLDDASSCAAVLCAANTRCVNGKCIPLGGKKRCKCGKSCTMSSGSMGVCQTDGRTCAQNIVAPNCGGKKRCKCGKSCTMTSGSMGVCQTDGFTCAQNVLPPNCNGPK